ncbi:MAG: chemotaxis protein CheB [Thermodesulfobacteriota bacterium]
MSEDSIRKDSSSLGAAQSPETGDWDRPKDTRSDSPSIIPPLLYVGIGASAGGLEAIESFFTHMPEDSGMAFIVIQHLSPDYKSLMVELLSKKTRMPVYRAEEGMQVAANSIYLIQPKKNLTIFHGKLLLNDPDPSKGLNLPIDIFFRSLAEDQAEKSVGIILSGTGSDGMRGVRFIKEAGGMVIVQSEQSAKFDGMPRSAISTGLADFILDPEEMPDRLLTIVKYPRLNVREAAASVLPEDSELDRIFSLLRDECKVDFTHYKPSTILRRIERRMTINRIPTLKEYAFFVGTSSQEIHALFHELLIGVTSFFRDAEAFQELHDRWLPDLFGRIDNREVRFWVPGCSTGEEAYSLAILCQEVMERLDRRISVKIFATDVDRDAIQKASSGLYHASAANDIPAEYLGKYFHVGPNEIRISRFIREMVVFAQHNLVKDPPFTNIDLISCRNLLIYLQPILQKKVLEYFVFSLNAGGILLLGKSETTGDLSDYFDALHHKYKIYRAQGKRLPMLQASDIALSQRLPAKVPIQPHYPRLTRYHEEERILERFLQAMAADYVLAAIVVNHHFELLHSVGEIGRFLHLPSGRMQNDVVKMAASEIAIPLATGLQRVLDRKEPITYSHIRIEGEEGRLSVQLRIKLLPARKGQETLLAVFFDREREIEIPEAMDSAVVFDMGKEARQRIQDLEQEVQFVRENLQATIEELETSNEELQAANEELLASNEELHSTNEELQSVNEELHTVNAEHQLKIMELTEVTNDLNNLMESSQIAALFLDEDLNIRKFTPVFKTMFNIRESDVGRPVDVIEHNGMNAPLRDWVVQVSATMTPMETQLQDRSGQWYLVRIVPYRIGPKIFSGMILSFVNITRMKAAETEAESNRMRIDEVASLTATGYWEIDPKTGCFDISPSILALLGIRPPAPLSLDDWIEMLHPDDRQRFKRLIEERASHGFDDIYRLKMRDSDAQRWIRLICRTNPKRPGRSGGAIQEMTHVMEMKQALADSENRYRELFEHIGSGVIVLQAVDAEGSDFRIVECNPSAQTIAGFSETEARGQLVGQVIPDIQTNGLLEMIRHVYQTGSTVRFPVLPYDRGSARQWLEHSLYRLSSKAVVLVYDDVTERVCRANIGGGNDG